MAAAIHGNRSQSQRVRALTDFKAGRVSILVATEVAARGIDIEELPHVVNYELPMTPEDYLHRIGRTGRAGIDRRRDLAGLRRRDARSCATSRRSSATASTSRSSPATSPTDPSGPSRSVFERWAARSDRPASAVRAGRASDDRKARRPGRRSPGARVADTRPLGMGARRTPTRPTPRTATPRAASARPGPASAPCPGSASLIAVTAARCRWLDPVVAGLAR